MISEALCMNVQLSRQWAKISENEIKSHMEGFYYALNFKGRLNSNYACVRLCVGVWCSIISPPCRRTGLQLLIIQECVSEGSCRVTSDMNEPQFENRCPVIVDTDSTVSTCCEHTHTYTHTGPASHSCMPQPHFYCHFSLPLIMNRPCHATGCTLADFYGHISSEMTSCSQSAGKCSCCWITAHRRNGKSV